MSYAPRFEEKYILSPVQYRRVLAGIAGRMQRDDYSKASPSGRYYVGSLYFDTSDYRAYMEKITGEKNRTKLRIRSYFRRRENAKFVSVELKTRNGRFIIKYGTHAPIDAYDRYSTTGRWGIENDAVLTEFERIERLQCQRPKVLVVYEREAYKSLRPSGLRISFDHGIRYARANSLFPRFPIYRAQPNRPIILEIKNANEGPDWLQQVVRDFSLKSVPHSKYANAVEQSQVDMFIPR